MIHPVILCGGAGTRLWPLSRADLPKQFIRLISNRTMLQDTALLVQDRTHYTPAIYLTGEDYRFLVERQIKAIGQDISHIIMEPHRRNTAPAIALAALMLARKTPDALMLVMPSDHIIKNVSRFQDCVQQAAIAARQGYLVTFGMKATRPETGFGYVQEGTPLTGVRYGYQVKNFTEKPDKKHAQAFIEDGTYHWNSGMFLFTAARYLNELGKEQPGILKACEKALDKGVAKGRAVYPDADAFVQANSISIDYAVMEKNRRTAVIRGDFGWSDVGSWSVLAKLDGEHELENTVVLKDCVDTYVRSESGRVIAAIGLVDHVVIDTKDALLIAPKNRAQDVKDIVEILREQHVEEADSHACVRRPWGTYEGVHVGKMHQVKHIVVDPGGKLSSQYHHHRAEHWIIVSGTAEVTVDYDTKIMHENESVYIPVEAIHRLANLSDQPLHLIEVQYGDYLGEDDIVRLDDIYGRINAPVAAE
ncbi:MAG: mannose-1-phosphate guanylyltransferase/mannose-6-phosphate isomerase [Rhodospirillaceae bacterium]|nr:MAG: mannose-1-phosphate guanylyltransferase/mannose-6-phosphate isomerase [Rhodospirillaceae bacterium]